LGGAEPLSIPYKLGVGMTASVKRKAAPVDLSAPAVTALEAALADKPLSLMIVAEYRDGVRVFSVPESHALQRGPREGRGLSSRARSDTGSRA
jgi:hypothetical protein